MRLLMTMIITNQPPKATVRDPPNLKDTAAHPIPKSESQPTLTEGEAELEGEDLDVGEVEEQGAIHGVAAHPTGQQRQGELLHDQREVHGNDGEDGPGDQALRRGGVLLRQLRRVVEAASCVCVGCVCMYVCVFWKVVCTWVRVIAADIYARILAWIPLPPPWIVAAHPQRPRSRPHLPMQMAKKRMAR